MGTKLQKAESKKNRAYEYLKKLIISNQLKPSEPLNEFSLATELQVSKTPVREALRQLEKDGLIDNNIFQKGWFVSEINIQDIWELFEIREILECSAVKMAALKADNERFIPLRNKLSELAPKNSSNLLKSGELVHISIFESLQNRRLLDMYRSLMEHHSRIRIYFVNKFEEQRLTEASKEHLEILNAIIAKDPSTAEELMRVHLNNGLDNIKNLMVQPL